MITEQEVKERTIERFWSKIKFGNPDECWEWLACVNNKGYGTFGINRKQMRYAHRYVYKALNPKFDESLNVCHACDNPLCVNPNHLWEGTQKQNIRDMHSKGRFVCSERKGSFNSNSKLTEDHVIIIKMRLALKESQQSIANAFKVSRSIIGEINRGANWTHVTI